MPIYMESDNGGDDFPGDIKAHIAKTFPGKTKTTKTRKKTDASDKTDADKPAVDPMRLIP